MHRNLLVVASLAGLVFTACQQSRAAATPSTGSPDEVAVKKIELRDGDNKPVTLAPSAPGASAGTKSAPEAEPAAPPQQATMLPLPPRKAPTAYEGAVVEDLGPCNGKGVAGYATINGEKKPICGTGGGGYSPYGYSRYGSSAYGYDSYNSPYRSGYSSRRGYRTPYNP